MTAPTQSMEPLPDGAKAIRVTLDQGQQRLFRNRCPHLGIPLDWGDGRCLTEDGLLICSMHAALFDPDSGECLAGPCAGQSLERLPDPVAPAGDGAQHGA